MEKYRIKITSGIFAGFTGVLGMGHQFVDGASVEELPTLEAQIIAAEGDTYIIDKDGEFVKNEAGHRYRVTPGAMPYPDTLDVSFVGQLEESDIEEEFDETFTEPAPTSLEDAEQPEIHTRETLEAIADKSGLRGLREIGEKVGVKGKSIPELIKNILNKQG